MAGYIWLSVEDEFGNVDVIRVDSAKDVERLKMIAEELDNDTGREVYLAFYSGVETVSQVAEKLGITIQLASYHVDKLVLAGLLREKGEPWFSVKGKAVKRYEPSKAALLIVPSLQYLRSNSEAARTMRRSLFTTLKRILPQILVPIGVFLTVLFSPKIASALQLIIPLGRGVGPQGPNISSNTLEPAAPNASLGFAGIYTSTTQFSSEVLASVASPAPLELLVAGIILGVVSWFLIRLARRN